MRHTFGLWVALLAFFSFISILMPSHAWASNADTISKMCDDGSFDQSVATNRAAFQQQLLSHAYNISNKFPIASAASQCLNQLAGLLRDLPSLTNPLSGIGSSIFSSIIASIIQNVCASVMDTIQSAQQALTSFTKICIPLPNFGSTSGLSFDQAPCDGSLQINTLSGGFAGTPQNNYGFSQYQSH